MRDITTIALSILLIASGLVSADFAEQFSDIDGHPYAADIEYIQSHSVVKGYPDGTFGPNRPITRAEITKIVIEGADDISSETPDIACFPDVPVSTRYAEYICPAKDKNIIKGYPDGTFQPERHVTIAEGLKIALETFEVELDRGSTDARYQPYLERVITNNLRERYELNPYAEMTRGQMSYLVARLMQIQSHDLTAVVPSSTSPGCQRASSPATPPTSFQAAGHDRETLTIIGDQYDHNHPTKLIIARHGRSGTPEEIRQYMKIEKKRDHDGIIVYPRRGGFSTRDVDRDGALFDQILEDIGNQYCIDYDQVYTMGHSLGAYFTHALSCSRGDVIRASGSVGGSTKSLECTGPVAGVIMHNPNDRLAGFAGGERARDQRLASNGCDPETYREYSSPTDANCVIYDQCRNESVVRCPHTENNARRDGSYYPHTRPSFATDIMLKYRSTLSTSD